MNNKTNLMNFLLISAFLPALAGLASIITIQPVAACKSLEEQQNEESFHPSAA